MTTVLTAHWYCEANTLTNNTASFAHDIHNGELSLPQPRHILRRSGATGASLTAAGDQ